MDIDLLVTEMISREPLLSEKRRPALKQMVERLVDKLGADPYKRFGLFKVRGPRVAGRVPSDRGEGPKERRPRDPRCLRAPSQVLRAHVLPLTNCAFNKQGDRFITGSYDRTCKVWDTQTGDELHTLEGHKNVVYAITFNNPFGDKVVTGSFDKASRGSILSNSLVANHGAPGVSWKVEALADVQAVGRLHGAAAPHPPGPQHGDRVRGHQSSVHGHRHGVHGQHGEALGRGARRGDCDVARPLGRDRGAELQHGGRVHSHGQLRPHVQGEAAEGAWRSSGLRCARAVLARATVHPAPSCAQIWDVRDPAQCVRDLVGHKGEVSACQFNFAGDLCISGEPTPGAADACGARGRPELNAPLSGFVAQAARTGSAASGTSGQGGACRSSAATLTRCWTSASTRRGRGLSLQAPTAPHASTGDLLSRRQPVRVTKTGLPGREPAATPRSQDGDGAV